MLNKYTILVDEQMYTVLASSPCRAMEGMPAAGRIDAYKAKTITISRVSASLDDRAVYALRCSYHSQRTIKDLADALACSVQDVARALRRLELEGMVLEVDPSTGLWEAA